MQCIVAVQVLCAIAMAAGSRAAAQDNAPPKEKQKSATAAPAAKPKPGMVSGRIFAITQGGDIKPARMARAFLLSWQGAEASVAQVWSKELETATTNRKMESSPTDIDPVTGETVANPRFTPTTELGRCVRGLLAYNDALSAALKWAKSRNKVSQFLFSQADEEGSFKFSAIEPGQYLLFANGQAGFNDAVWIESNVEVKTEVETLVKLSVPEKACLVMN